MTRALPTTKTHTDPSEGARSPSRAMLLVAYPRPVAIPVPESDVPVGRAWLEKHGLQDTEVSSEHLTFSRRGGHVRVRDGGAKKSKNGTFVDGTKIGGDFSDPLRDGTLLRIGRTLLVLRRAFEGEDDPAPPLGALVAPWGLRELRRAIDAIAAMAERRADMKPLVLNVLIEGETGTGKELVAAAIARRLRPGKPYGAVNMGALTDTLAESQLFGHVAGAFSSAVASPGVIAAHEGGVVFLDEIGELPLPLQPKLLRFLDYREIARVGASRTLVAEKVIVIAATNRVLDDQVASRAFREDLLARMEENRLKLPSLRDRAEDIWPIAEAMLARSRLSVQHGSVEIEAVERLLLHPFPRNARELGAIVTKMQAQGFSARSAREALGGAEARSGNELDGEKLQAALVKAGWNVQKAAEALGMDRGKLYRAMERFQISRPGKESLKATGR